MTAVYREFPLVQQRTLSFAQTAIRFTAMPADSPPLPKAGSFAAGGKVVLAPTHRDSGQAKRAVKFLARLGSCEGAPESALARHGREHCEPFPRRSRIAVARRYLRGAVLP